jgi:hypothetical protein
MVYDLTLLKKPKARRKLVLSDFKLSLETEPEPSFFEIAFIMSGRKYRYGFEATSERVVSEWLFYVPKLREQSFLNAD